MCISMFGVGVGYGLSFLCKHYCFLDLMQKTDGLGVVARYRCGLGLRAASQHRGGIIGKLWKSPMLRNSDVGF